MKANFIIGKKQIILSALVVILGGAIYVNYIYANQEKDYPVTDVLNSVSQSKTVSDNGEVNAVGADIFPDETVSTAGENSVSVNPSQPNDTGKNYGDAQLVNGPVTTQDDYFAQASLNKTKSRDEAVETVKSVLAKADASDEEISQATAKIVEISKQISDESKIENLIKAKGFEDCVVYLDNGNANVVVKTDGLSAEQAAQIKNIVLSEKDVAQENISITEVAG